ncbi:MAG TPA: MFS transporter [Chitinophagales bacterium]|nr:MFS transporter [Chitinophagales bacterium]
MSKTFLRNDKKLINRWAMYDWANSVYSLSIATAIFPIYYTNATNEVNNGIVHFIGRDYDNEALYSYAISFSFLVVALLSPLLAPIADFKNSKLGFMKFFCYLGAASCAALYFFTGENISWGIGFFILAAIGFAGSIVYYNAYLKEIVDEHDMDRVSAKGFSLGYIGSVILLIFNLMMVLKPEWFGIHDPDPKVEARIAARISFISVGIWWVAFAQIPFYALKRFSYQPPVKGENGHVNMTWSFIFGGYNELRKVWNEIRHYRSLKNFLFAFFFYNSAVQTVMYLASNFGAKVIFKDDPDGTSKLIVCVLIIQIVGILGAVIFSRVSRKFGNVISLSISISIWIVVCVFAYFLKTQMQFYIVAFAVGMVMGGVQSISRSTYSKLIPPTKDTASFFSFYDSTEKIATVFGTAVFGLVTEFTGNMRNSVLFLFVFFIIGLYMLWKLRDERALKPSVAAS